MTTELQWIPTLDGAVFRARTGNALPSFPVESTEAGAIAASLELLERLWGEERATRDDGEVRLPWDTVFELDPRERAELGIPEPSAAIKGELRSHRWVNRPDFSLTFTAEGELAGREISTADRSGPVFILDGERFLPIRPLARLLVLLDRPMPEATDERTVLVAEAQRCAMEAGVRLDPYLRDEEYVFPEGLGLDVEGVSPDEIHLHPILEGLDTDDYPRFQEQTSTRTTYTQRLPDGRRRRVVLDAEQRKAVDAIKRRRVLRGPDVPRFFENPEAFAPDLFDLEKFSPRVRGLIPQRYQSQPYLTVHRTEKRDWFEVKSGVVLHPEGSVPESPAIGERPQEPSSDPKLGGDQAHGGEAGAEPPGPEGDEALDASTYRELCERVVETGEPFHRHGDSWIKIDPSTARQFLERWAHVEHQDGRFVIPKSRIQMILDVVANTEELEFDLGAQDFHADPEVDDYPVPDGLRAQLYPHQEKGYRWMRYLYDNEWGGLLADDMGLGKTVQVIALMAHLHETEQLRPALIVVPKSLMLNWQREIRRFAPGIRLIHRHHGSNRHTTPGTLSLNDVVITTYGTLRRDQVLMGQVDWSIVVCDEAQNVKNPTANITAAAKGMKGRFRLASTGTPVENGLSELWCLVDFAQPGKLGSRRDFRDSFERPIVEAEESSSTRAEAAGRLQRHLIPHYVRRTKDQLPLDLPEKRVEFYEVGMGDRQKDLYVGLLGDVRSGREHALSGLQKLIQVCSHPELHEDTGSGLDALLSDSPKLAQTLQILRSIQASHEKVVVFTRFRGMQRILRDLVVRYFGFAPRVLNGETAGDNRQAIVDMFNQSPGFNVMILSPEAAGVGLNITGANHAIHYTRLWNPAKELQATDRIYRIGQDRPVTVHYPIVRGDGFKSVEEHLHDLIEEKVALARDVMVPKGLMDLSAELQARISEAGADA